MVKNVDRTWVFVKKDKNHHNKVGYINGDYIELPYERIPIKEADYVKIDSDFFDIEELEGIINDYRNEHGNDGIINCFEYDIKLDLFDIPEIIVDNLSHKIDDFLFEEFEFALKNFISDLQDYFGLNIEKWCVAGRSGGWLQIKLVEGGDERAYDLIDTLSDVQEEINETKEEEIEYLVKLDYDEWKEVMKELQESYYLAKNKLFQLAIQALFIGQAVKEGKKQLEEDIGKIEFWEPLLESERLSKDLLEVK